MHTRQQRQIVCFFIIVMLSGLAAGATELTFRQSCSCSSNYITVGDLADIADCDEETQKSLAAVQLLPAPSHGRKRTIGVREVQELLALQGVDVLSIRFRGPSRIEVESKPMPATAESVADEKTGSLVVMAVRPLRRGEIIRDGDVELRQLHSKVSASARQQAVQRLDDAIGMQVNRAISSGQIVDRNTLQRPLIVHRAATVTVYARIGGIQVATKGRALADGAMDDVVTVELLENRDKRVAGRVTGLDEVEVFAQGAAVGPEKMRPLPVTRQRELPNTRSQLTSSK